MSCRKNHNRLPQDRTEFAKYTILFFQGALSRIYHFDAGDDTSMLEDEARDRARNILIWLSLLLLSKQTHTIDIQSQSGELGLYTLRTHDFFSVSLLLSHSL